MHSIFQYSKHFMHGVVLSIGFGISMWVMNTSTFLK